jgi:predicted transcriptional regulator
VQNYVSKFRRIVALAEEGYDINTIAFLVKLSASLVQTYYELYRKEEVVPHRRKELESFLKKGVAQPQERRLQ